MRRGMRRAARQKRETIWTALAVDNQAILTAVAAGNIVESADWSNVGGFAKGCTLKRIRGCYSIGWSHSASINSMVDLAIFKLAVGETTPDPDDVATMVLEDVLWHRRLQISGAVLTSVGGAFDINMYDIDVKAQRKLTTNDRIAFAFQCSSTTGGPTLSMMVRGLVAKL